MSRSPIPNWLSVVFGVVNAVAHPIKTYRERRERKRLDMEIADALRGDAKPIRYTEKA